MKKLVGTLVALTLFALVAVMWCHRTISYEDKGSHEIVSNTKDTISFEFKSSEGLTVSVRTYEWDALHKKAKNLQWVEISVSGKMWVNPFSMAEYESQIELDSILAMIQKQFSDKFGVDFEIKKAI